MAEFLDRKAVLKALKTLLADENDYSDLYYDGYVDGVYDAEDAVKSLPSADVQPRKTAEWVYGEKDGADGWYCSGCKFHIPWYYDYYGLKNINFIRDFHTCPHCDAKMLKYTGMKGKWDETSSL